MIKLKHYVLYLASKCLILFVPLILPNLEALGADATPDASQPLGNVESKSTPFVAP